MRSSVIGMYVVYWYLHYMIICSFFNQLYCILGVSSTLVQLLLENDALQQESDARNVCIEQLLKMTVKVNENDLKPVQMSIILPDDDCDDI